MAEPLTAERAARFRSMLTALRADTEADVIRFEGQPFTGRAVGEALGQLGAQIDALAGVCAVLLDEVAPDE
jgi:hypothetical protein